LTLAVIYPKNAFRLAVLSNISPQILAIFGNFVHQLAAHLQQHVAGALGRKNSESYLIKWRS